MLATTTAATAGLLCATVTLRLVVDVPTSVVDPVRTVLILSAVAWAVSNVWTLIPTLGMPPPTLAESVGAPHDDEGRGGG